MGVPRWRLDGTFGLAAPERQPVRALNAAYDDFPELYDTLRDSWLNRRREQFIVDHLRNSGMPGGAAVLEIGSGTGWLLNRLGPLFPDLVFVGLEPIRSYVEFAQQRSPPNVRYLNGEAETVHLQASATFQAVLSNDVLHHVQSYEETISSVSRVCAAGATWLAIEPNWKNPYTAFKQALTAGERNFRPAAFSKLASRQGWELQCRRHLFLVPPFVRFVPESVKYVERTFEWVPFLAGGVCLELRRPSGAGGMAWRRQGQPGREQARQPGLP